MNENTVKWWNDKYSEKGSAETWSSERRLIFYRMISTAIPREKATIIDIGSGLGFGPDYLRRICNKWSIEGLDFSPKACLGAVVETHCVDIINSEIPSKYDYVISAETLEHFDNPMKIISKMYKSARNAVLFTVPYNGNISSIHVSSFSENSFDMYRDVKTTLSPDKHFMLTVIPVKS